MKLNELLKGIDFEVLAGNADLEISNITWDSRNVDKNSLFIAVKNKNADRHDFALDAVNKGAIALVIEHEIENVPKNITVIKVNDSKKSMSVIAQNYYGNPMKKLKVIGVTGTNGKTSVTYFISKILETFNIKSGIIGTIENT
ncbi:MAG: Mur ligase domain-containing protein, partial [Bacillota bacterium]|nr:Mur ligase domain-containing protein [Bacillota bacterium]